MNNEVDWGTSHSEEVLSLLLQICLNLEAFESNTTSDWLNRRV